MEKIETRPVTTLHDIFEGDTLLVDGYHGDGEHGTKTYKAERVKVSRTDGTEIIIDVKHNKFFNLGMYLDGKSWVKNVSIVEP